MIWPQWPFYCGLYPSPLSTAVRKYFLLITNGALNAMRVIVVINFFFHKHTFFLTIYNDDILTVICKTQTREKVFTSIFNYQLSVIISMTLEVFFLQGKDPTLRKIYPRELYWKFHFRAFFFTSSFCLFAEFIPEFCVIRPHENHL